MRYSSVTVVLSCITAASTGSAFAQAGGPETRPSLTIPHMAAPPVFESFLDMRPPDSITASMARVDRFIQRWPADGEPERMKTIAYIGYTDTALHVVYLAFDPDPAAVRAHLIRREDVFDVNDDEVELRLDTYGDGRQS